MSTVVRDSSKFARRTGRWHTLYTFLTLVRQLSNTNQSSQYQACQPANNVAGPLAAVPVEAGGVVMLTVTTSGDRYEELEDTTSNAENSAATRFISVGEIAAASASVMHDP